MSSHAGDPDPLAIHGGSPAFPSGPPSWPGFDAEVHQAAQAACTDGSWGRYLGAHGDRLRERLANVHGTPHVKLCSSGTVGIELALRAAGVAPGDEVILGGYDFPGNFRAIERVGARPVLADIEPQTLCLAPSGLDQAYSPQVKAIVASHLHSGIADMPAIRAWACQRRVFVVEDACQAQGAQVHGRPAGSWGDAGVLSFGGSKVVTAGRGGAVLLHDPAAYQRLKIYADQGNDAYPLSELQAAVLLPQWEALPDRNRQRRTAVAHLRDLLADVPQLEFLGNSEHADWPAYYRVAWRWNPTSTGCDRDEFAAAMRAEGVAIDPGFSGFFRRGARRCRHADALTETRRAAESVVSLHHPILTLRPRQVTPLAAIIRRVARALA
ncbi:MAG: DegT/DnrJ/EryC1/StrS family aminotransferase [Planctomycetales bacterium]|nr:DegT/DnrJ/EryC1/StrS family aminotransferase [Planctomycetales bacterium]